MCITPADNKLTQANLLKLLFVCCCAVCTAVYLKDPWFYDLKDIADVSKV